MTREDTDRTSSRKPLGRRRLWPFLAGGGVLLLLVALLAGTALKLADSGYRPNQSLPGAPGAPGAPAGDAIDGTRSSDIAADRSTSPETTAGTPVRPVPPVDSGSAAGTPIVPPEQDKIVKTGELVVSVGDDKVEQAFADTGSIARELGGFVSQSNSRAGSADAAYATLVLRIPAQRFEEAVDRVGKLGDVKSLSTSAQDVTGQLVDLSARLRNLEAQRDQIMALMSQAKTVQETITIQDRLFSVTEQIEQLKGRLAVLNSQTAYSTLNVSISRSSVVPERPGSGWGTGRALSRAAHAFVDTLNGFVVLMGPLAFLAILGVLVWLLVAAFLRRRRYVQVAHGNPPPASPPAPPAQDDGATNERVAA